MKATIIGIDLAKHLFQLHGVDQHGKTVLKRLLKRKLMLSFFSNHPPRGCRHEMTAYKYVQQICTAATNELVFLAYLVAIPRHCFRCKKAFSTRCLAL